MKISMPSKYTKYTKYTLQNVRESLLTINKWWVNTPERGLEKAYQAALRIKKLEDEYFGGNKITPDFQGQSKSIINYTLSDLYKYLYIAKIRIAEFKLSRLVIETLDSQMLAKLVFVDDIIAKYKTETISSSDLLEVTNQSINLRLDSSQHAPTINQRTFKPSLLPRSIGSTVNRITTELKPNSEQEIINRFRQSSIKTKIAIKFIIFLIVIPLVTQQISKNFLIYPIVERVRGTDHSHVFINSEMREEALSELKIYEEELHLVSLIPTLPKLSSGEIENKITEKASEIGTQYWQRSSSAISNVFADLVASLAFILLLLCSKKEIIALKDFMNDIIYGLSDSAKAFIIILLTDIFVGYHSSHGWEIILEGLANHLGIAPDRNLIFAFIATFPVILDTIFKYWIFRYLSRSSPSAVATLKNMNE